MPKVGGEIISYCTKCKLDLNHVIHAMVGELPVRVECFTCHSTHKYHEPKEAKAAAKAAKVLGPIKPVNRATNGSAGSSRASSSDDTSFDSPKTRTKAPVIDPSEAWANLLKGKTNAAKSYDMTASFTVGDVVEHPSFGMGVVEKRLEPQKISVVFRDGAKNLVDNR